MRGELNGGSENSFEFVTATSTTLICAAYKWVMRENGEREKGLGNGFHFIPFLVHCHEQYYIFDVRTLTATTE